MIQANELRIGNLIKHVSKKDEYLETDVQRLANVSRNPIPYKPIPLSEEWLLKFGFKYDKPHDLFSKYGFDIQLLDDGIEFYIGEYGSYFTLLNYVHQLQNLYFALTQTELELKQI